MDDDLKLYEETESVWREAEAWSDAHFSKTVDALPDVQGKEEQLKAEEFDNELEEELSKHIRARAAELDKMLSGLDQNPLDKL